MKIGVIGGGLTGLALARGLASRGHAVCVLERDAQLGGLATYHDYGPFFWDRFYHCILPSDQHLLRLLADVGLGQGVHWARTLTGFHVDRRMYSLSSGVEFLRFPALGFLQKLRLAWMILRCSRINDWQSLEKVRVGDWLVRQCGRATYEKLWKPLLLAKLGQCHERVSAVFIWSYIKRMFSARDPGASKEHLGYVSGGYRAVLARLEEIIRGAGGDIRTRCPVDRIRPCDGGGILVEHGGTREHFDKVVFTGPVDVLRRVAPQGLVRIQDTGRTLEYLGVVSLAVVTRKPVVPYYIVNVADDRIPFTGIIGMSNLVSTDEFAGMHLTYLPKYVLSGDELLRAPDDEIRLKFLEGLRTIVPELDPADIVGCHVQRAAIVQPLQVLDYSKLVPTVATENADFYVLNTSQFVNCTLNNNEVVRAVGEFLERHEVDFAAVKHGDGPPGVAARPAGQEVKVT